LSPFDPETKGLAVKTTTTLAALAAILVGATCSGQISLPTYLPIGSTTERAKYEAGKVQNIGVNLFSDPFFFPDDDRDWGKQLLATGERVTVSDADALATLALTRKQECVRYAWEVGRDYLQRNSQEKYDLEVICWGPGGASGGIILFISHTFFHLENQGGEWRFPAWITNTPPTLNLARDFYLEVPAGIQGASIRVMDGAANVETVYARIQSGSKVKPQRRTPGCLYVDTSGFMMIPQRLLSPTARRLVLTLDYGTNGIVKFNENGQLITGKEPIWLGRLSHYGGGELGDPGDDFYVYFEPGATVEIQVSAGLSSPWTTMQSLNDKWYSSGQTVYDSWFDGRGLGADQAAVARYTRKTLKGATHLFYRARYKE
jgi:hypothetical protein